MKYHFNKINRGDYMSAKTELLESLTITELVNELLHRKAKTKFVKPMERVTIITNSQYTQYFGPGTVAWIGED